MVQSKVINLIFLLLISFSVAAQTNNEVKEISKTAITNGAGIQIVSGQISVVDNQTEQKVRVYKAGSIGGIRRSINFIEGSNVTITPVDNAGSDRIDVTIALSGVQPLLVSGTNIKTINGNSLLGSGDLTITASAIWGAISGDIGSQTDLQSALNGKSDAAHTHTFASLTSKPTTVSGFGITDNYDGMTDYQSALEALGSTHKAQTVGQPLQYCNVSSNLTDNQIRYTAVYLNKAQTITGVKVYVRVLGSYTGDQTNGVALYSYSGGTMTKVAESTNSATLWTNAANSIQTIAFSSTYSAQPGIYFVGILYNNSAQTTAPALASGVALNNVAMATLDFTNSAKLYGTVATQNTFPATQAMSGVTASTAPTWVALY